MRWEEVATGDHWLLSPHLSGWQKNLVAKLQAQMPRTDGTIWILSSGTQSVASVKAIGLTQKSILISAEAVNRHLSVTAQDRWLLALPTYHIGGLAILARAHLAGNQVVEMEKNWEAKAFVEQVKKTGSPWPRLCPLKSLTWFNWVSNVHHPYAPSS